MTRDSRLVVSACFSVCFQRLIASSRSVSYRLPPGIRTRYRCLFSFFYHCLVYWTLWSDQVERQGRQKILELHFILTLNLKSSRFLAFILMPSLTTDFGTQLVISLEGKARNTDVDAPFAVALTLKETTYLCLRVSLLLTPSKRNSVMFQSFHAIT